MKGNSLTFKPLVGIFTAAISVSSAQATLVVNLDASALAQANNTTVAAWGPLTSTGTPTFQTNRTPNGGSAVVFNGTDRLNDNFFVPASAANDFIVAAVIKPTAINAYHNIIDDDAQNRPMLWVDNLNRYEPNFGGGTGNKAIGTGPSGWDVVIFDSRTNKLLLNGNFATGGGAIAHSVGENFDFFHRDGGQTFQGEVAELRVYNNAADFDGKFGALASDLRTKWIGSAFASVEIEQGQVSGLTPSTLLATSLPVAQGQNNVALASNGGLAFAQDVINLADPRNFRPFRANDGLYSDAPFSPAGTEPWIGLGLQSFVGIKFAGAADINRIGFQDEFVSRRNGTITLEYTTDSFGGVGLDANLGLNPAQVAALNWITIDSRLISDTADTRHLYEFATLFGVTGIRMRVDASVSAGGSGVQFAVAELEAWGQIIPEPASLSLLMLGSLALGRRRRLQA